ncbi:mucin-2-like [Hemibagrus wyckioides]|uniref:mucin-2-like n=1 Tax=Hemibagrus wyckioides TaxID=337641 RepID=UPI00266D6A4A|nr:mucin-2-like [Hemibagrus wyckioides]
MAQHWIILGILVFFSGPFGFVSTQSTNVCKTFGSGVMQTFNTTMFHVKTTCPVIMTHFSHAGVDCFISVQRDPNGLMKRVEILVNKVATIVQNGILTVEGNSISLPYDHTYQKVYAFGIYTRLTSKVLPLSVTWYSLPESVTLLWVQLDRPLVEGMTGICGGRNISETQAELLDRNVIRNGICVTGDSQPVEDKICSDFKSNARECLGKRLSTFDHLCRQNMYINVNESAKCSFCEEFLHSCNYSYAQLSNLRSIISCKEHHCPGDLQYKDQGAAFPPTCSNPQLQTEFRTATCLPPNGLVLNDRVEGYHCVKVEDCPCVHRGRIYAPGEQRSTKCQTCECIKGKWICSANTCLTPCIIEGWFVTTFDGKQYSLPGTCTYVAARGLNWTITIRFSAMTIEEIYLDVYQERYIFSLKSVKLRENQIIATDLSQTEYVTVYWQSSMFVMVKTSFGMKMQVQVSPEVQMYLYLPKNVTATGLCGSNNNNTEDDFTTSSGIVENSAQPFALSWTLGDCTANHPYVCVNTDNEIFAEDKCSQLTNTSGVFAQCHEYVPVNSYFDACVRRTCQATSGLQERVCVGLGNYAKACASQGIIIGDWRAETGCTPSCESNLRFDYTMQACNHTCRSLSAPDPTCNMSDDPVEGCGCLHGTHLNTPLRCSPRALCHCNYPGGTTHPGPVVIDGHQCMCENGNLHCSDFCDCPHGQICVHCAQAPVNTVQRTCESLSKPSSSDESCISGCYCPPGQYADHRGNCVTQENCTCEFSGMVYATMQTVESNCKTCTCRGGHWDCKGDPCPGVCEVFGNGQYKTFDSKWYRFDGHCQYTLVEDIYGLFSINAESVPCCDEALTCSRSISVKLKDEVTLILSDMNVTQKLLNGWRFRAQSLYSVHTVGLYIIISVPELGLSVIWDKQTKVKIELQASWSGKVRGLCGDFDGKLINDLMTSSSTVVFSTLEFGNSWKTAVPPCSDVTQELFPCERHSYCAAWAERRCMILRSDTFKACHLKVDPAPYYQACVLESCSCDFEGKFLGFCTAVAAYADACTNQNVCIKWRTPDLCPIYCDYYNEEGQYSWHYEACPQQIKTCGKNNKFSGKLEGCYPQCPTDMPYYDENRRICTSLDKCTCYFNNTVVEPGAKVTTPTECCECIGGQLICQLCITSPTTTVTSKATSVPNTTVPKTTTTTNTPIITFKIITGTTSTSITKGQESNYTIIPEITITKTTKESTTTTPITTITTETTIITTTSTPEITTENDITTTITTERPITTSTQKITSVSETTTPSTPMSTKTRVMTTTTTPEVTPEESVSTTSLIRTSATTEAPSTTSTTEITTEEHKTTPTEIPVTTTVAPETTSDTTPEESTPLTTTSTVTETTVTTTTSTPEITTEEEKTTTTTPITTITTETPITTTTGTTVTTRTTSIISEESPSTTLLTTTTTETPITTSTTEITTNEPKTTAPLTITTFRTPLTTTSAVTETTVTTTTSTPEITTEEHKTTTTTPITTITTETPITTTTGTTIPTRTTSIISEESPSTTLLTTTTTETPITSTTEITTNELKTTSSDITPEESTFTTPVTTTSAVTETTVTTTTSTPEITTEEHKTTTTTPITTITTETPVTTMTGTTVPTRTTSIISEESPSTTLLTTTTTETPITTSTTEITTNEPKTTAPLTITTFRTPLTTTSAVTETTVTTTTSSPEITTEEHKTTTTTPITTITTETPITTMTGTTVTTRTTSTSIITEESPSTTLLTTTTTETPVTTSTTEITTNEPKTTSSDITPEESTFTTPLTTTSAVTETTVTTTTSIPEITTEEEKTTATTPITTITTETPITTMTGTTVTTRTTSIISEESPSTTLLTTTTTETPITTSTTEITTNEPKTTAPLTITTFRTPLTTTSAVTETTVTTITSTPEITTEEHKTITTTPITTITTETPVTTTTPAITVITATSLITTETSVTTSEPSLTTTESPITTSTSKITTVSEPTTPITATTTESPITTSTSKITTVSEPTTPITATTTESPITTSTSKITTVSEPTTPITATTTESPITTSTSKITTVSEPTTPITATTTESPITTSTSKITTVSEPTTPITATTTESPITTTTTSTPEITTEGTATPVTAFTTENTIPHNTACKDLIRNQTWPEGYEWTEDCFTKICKNNVIELRPLTCPTPVIPVCPRGIPQLVKDKQGCCDTWQCDCQCDVFGDPHYTTFAGQDFVFLENCTYVLVEERTPQYHLSISVDNYYCETSASCAKGIIVHYQNNTAILQVLEVPDEMPLIQTTLNEVTIKPPYQAYGFRFESTDAEIYIYIEDIRSYIFLSVWNTLQINLAMEYFFNNTQGQCGVCGGASCIRRNGSVESNNCCDKTAYEWIENDPLKPYCQQARQHVPCSSMKLLTTTISPSILTPFCTAPLCDLLRHQVFNACIGDIDVERLVSNCKFDYCVARNNASVCSPLERLAGHCKKMGICVAWRNLTSGICDIACPEGMILDECRSTPNDFCHGSERVPGRVLDAVISGCFCPENQLLAETHKKICVSECTNCKGPLGEPMPVGAIWESNCHMCTCDNQTRTEECWPKPPLPTPICSPGFALTSDCCNNQICVEKTCKYSGTIYKVGEMWRDPKSPCLTYHCTSEGTEIERTVCPQQICPEELRVWDEHHCCYSCNTTCGVSLSRMTFENCTQEVMLPTCEGNCASDSLWVRSGKDLQLEHKQFCCREKDYEIRPISLLCSGTTATQYTYKHITSCECQREV